MKQQGLPRWRGFNLEAGISLEREYHEQDFQMIADLGFDFVRLPVRYDRWSKPDHPFEIQSSALEFLDAGVRYAEKYNLHVCLNLHKAPGFSVQGFTGEPFKLFQDDEATRCFCFHWEMLARRYRSQKNMSFNLLNEPRWVAHQRHDTVMRAAIEHIRKIDETRLLILDGVNTGNDFPLPLAELAADHVAFSTRGYVPLGLTHYEATWGHHQQYEKQPPQWPNGRNRISSTGCYDGLWDRPRLETKYRVWASLAQVAGAGVVCGECGCYCRTPHDIALAWMEDLLDILTQYNIGYALWNFRGPFGILDSQRNDVAYEDYRGHLLDRKMLELLKRY